MSSKPFPDSHTTQTTTTTTTVIVRPYLEFSYLRSVPGILKLIELVLDFLVFICLVAGPLYAYGGVGWATFVSITAFIATMIMLWLYLFHVIELYNTFPWLLVEMTYCALTAFCYLIASFVTSAGAVRWKGAWHWDSWAVAAELIMCAILALNFFIASCVMAAAASSVGYSGLNPGPFAAGAFFGFIVMFCYGFDCFLKFQAWRSGGVAQGAPRTSSTMHSAVTVH